MAPLPRAFRPVITAPLIVGVGRPAQMGKALGAEWREMSDAAKAKYK